MEKIQLLVSGGTFDKEYNELTGELFFKDTHVHEMLTLGRSRLDITIETICMKDSLEFDQSDREKIALSCSTSSCERILITHGTDTMTQTAQFLAAQSYQKTIVLTGAMVPYKFGSSDGLFNLGSSLAFLQTLPHGVYISMNGQYFPANQVIKNKEKGIFESTD